MQKRILIVSGPASSGKSTREDGTVEDVAERMLGMNAEDRYEKYDETRRIPETNDYMGVDINDLV